MPFPPQVEQWRSLIQRLGSGIPTDYALAWAAKESGGNVCSLGIPNVEAGLFQTFHPEDDRFGATFSQLRAACSGSKLARQLTPAEAELQVRHGVNFIRAKAAAARAHLAAGGARWSEGSTDFWTAVKQEHALPCVMASLFPRAAKKLGRAPRNWAEFKAVVMSMSPSEMDSGCARFAQSASTRGLRNRLEDTMANAEEVGQFGGGGVGQTLLKIGIVGALAWGAYKLWQSYTQPTETPP